MPITHGPVYRLPCPASAVWVGKQTGQTYCRDCDRPVTVRKDGRPRAHKGPKVRDVIFTGDSAAAVSRLGRFVR